MKPDLSPKNRVSVFTDSSVSSSSLNNTSKATYTPSNNIVTPLRSQQFTSPIHTDKVVAQEQETFSEHSSEIMDSTDKKRDDFENYRRRQSKMLVFVNKHV